VPFGRTQAQADNPSGIPEAMRAEVFLAQPVDYFRQGFMIVDNRQLFERKGGAV